MNNIYYYADFHSMKVNKCVLRVGSSIHMIQEFNEDGTLQPYSHSCSEDDLFKTEDEANERIEYLSKLYNKTFKRKPFLNEDKLVPNLDKLLYIENEIESKLSDHPNFKGIDFCDVSAGGIQIRGHHKEIKGYSYGGQPTIKYDFSNYEEIIDQFVDMWKKYDVPERVASEKRFIADGEKYGWD